MSISNYFQKASTTSSPQICNEGVKKSNNTTESKEVEVVEHSTIPWVEK